MRLGISKMRWEWATPAECDCLLMMVLFGALSF